MGNKPLTKPQKTDAGVLEKVIFNYSNGDKYEGTILNGDLHGQGTYYYRNTDVYRGEWKNNKKNGLGTHYYIKQGKRFVGTQYIDFFDLKTADIKETGKMACIKEKQIGCFLAGEKNGIGYYREEDGKTYQEVWDYGKLVKRALVKTPISDIQKIDLNAKFELEEEEHVNGLSDEKGEHALNHEHDDGREIIDFNELPDPADHDQENDEHEHENDDQENDDHRKEDDDDDTTGRAGSKKSGSDKQFSQKYSSPESKQEDQTSSKRSKFSRQTKTKNNSEGSGEDGKSKSRNQNHTLFSKDLDSETETVKFGVDTINLMEHMEVLNSAANWLLNKPIQEWTAEDVAEWLIHLGLGEYADKFKENHINGKNLLDLNENDLKEEFQITILGHRKTLQRNITLLNQINNSGKNTSYVKEKIKKFYEGKKKPKMPQMNNFNSFNSFRKFASGKYDSKHEAIEEIDDEAEFYSHSPRNEPKTSEHPKRSSTKSLDDAKLNSKESDHQKERSYESERRRHSASFASENSADSRRDGRKKNQKMKRQMVQAPTSSGDKADEEKHMSDHSEEAVKGNRGSNEKPNNLNIDANQKESANEQNTLGLSKTRSPLRGAAEMKEMMQNDGFQLNNDPIVVIENNNSSSDESSSDSETSSSGDEKEKPLSKAGNLSRGNSNLNVESAGTSQANSQKGILPNAGGQRTGHSNSMSAATPLAQKVTLKRAGTQGETSVQKYDGDSKRQEESKKVDEQGQQGQGKAKLAARKKNSRNDQEEEQIKTELFKILKETGLNENFIINYNELETKNKVGEGGYGQVYRGVFSGTDVAIKKYGKRKLHRKAAEDFVKEVKVISSLRHPNIVLYMGACIHKGKYLMITEYLEEGSLFDHLHRKHTKLPEDKMLAICEDIALGMTYLHSRKVLHCDLKSSNILIDSNWSVKLCDFGLSRTKIGYKKKKKGTNKDKSIQKGTPNWMAPEILRGEDYNEYSDVYSYGMVLWEMVTDEIPYANMNTNEIMVKVGLDKKQVDIPTKGHPVILQIIKMCLNFDGEKRPKFKEITEKLQESIKELAKKKGNKFFGGIFADKTAA